MNTLPNENTIKLTIDHLSIIDPESNTKVLPLTLFTPLSSMSWSIWLDSCQSEHIDSRFDILVWQPETTLCTFGLETHIKNAQDELHISEDDPLLLVEQYKAQLFSQSSIENLTNDPELSLPFVGGALGYLSYDLGRRFEQLPEKTEHDLSLPDMAIGIYNQAIVFDKKKQCAYLICPDNKRHEITAFLQQQLASSPTEELEAFKLTNSWQSNIDKQQYQQKFEQVKDYLYSGDCYQINLAQRFSASYTGDEFQAYQALRLSNNAPFSAFMRFDNAAILSISPERFLSVEHKNVQSKPIKGTIPRSDNEQIDRQNAQTLKNSLKDRAENVMIVDLLRNDISKVCQPGSVIVPELFSIESFPAVHHLVSTVEGKLSNEFNNTDLLRAAFPGGSITGAPKIRAMEIIEELEPNRRSVYCGSIGYISACGNMDTSITIRTLICEKNSIHCWAGGGLVADSTLESEYQETFDKVEKILPVLSKL